MFIQVPESVSKSLKKGHVPKTQIHYPKSSFQNQDPASAVWVDNVGIHESRNVFTGRFECSCTTTVPTVGPGWIPWSSAMIPTHEQHRMCRELYSNLPVVLSPHGSPSRQGVVELKMQNGEATVEEVSVVKQDQHIEDDIESIESPRSFASSGSTSSREDTLINLTPELLCSAPGPASPVPKPRSQQANPWGKASYSDLITMAITSREDNMMTLSDIYSWIVKNVPYFNDKGTYLSVQGWKNAVRHTLSLRKRFVRVPDPKRPYKSMWTISEDYQRNHLKDKKRHSKIKRRRSETTQGHSQPMDLDGAVY